MNLENLKTFREVVRLGSFSEVAKSLSISQPAVSFQIQKLEQELGIRLIDRTQRSVTLTAAGRRLLQFAASIESQREQLQHDLEYLRENVSGDLLIAASTIPGEFLLPPLLAKFRQQHPAARIQVVGSDSLTVIKGVSDNTFEIGFCGVPPQGKELESFRIAGDEIVLIVFPDHPFARRGGVSPDELAGEPFIFREETSGTQQSLKTSLAEAGLDLKQWSPNLVLGTTQAVVAAVEERAGIAFVSSLAIKKSLELGLVKQVAVGRLKLNRQFYGIYRRGQVVSRLLEEFIKFMREGASSQVG